MTTSTTLRKLTLEEMVYDAQNGDEEVLNHLLNMYQPFVAKCVSEVCKRFINPKHDDEFSIGLMAFNEAIMNYVPERGAFFSFAKLVIKRKVIDYIRSLQKYPKTVSFDETFDEEQMENPTEVSIAKDNYVEEQDAMKRKEEIQEFAIALKDYKLSFVELTEVSPKHKDARESAIEIAKMVYEDESMREHIRTKKKLPIKTMLKQVSVSKKTLERNRKFILAIFVVLDGDYLYLKEYLKGIGL